MTTKLDPKDAALVAFIETIGNTGGIVALTHEESAASYGAPYGCKFDRESTDLASAYLLACKATGVAPIIEPRLPSSAHVEIVLERSASEEANDEETEAVHSMASVLPKEVKMVRVLDCDGTFLYYADGREG